jgi:cbb3-type cytochrome oxidase subunit 3
MELARSLVTLAAFVSFLAIVWWAYGTTRKSHFESLGKSILEEGDE